MPPTSPIRPRSTRRSLSSWTASPNENATPRQSPVRPDLLEFATHSDTLLAVVVGAVLATFSGIAATQLEAHLKRRERERDAALLFGELLSTLRILLDNAIVTRGRGDPYGAITVRMLRAVRRE